MGTCISFLSDVLGDKYVYVLEDLIFLSFAHWLSQSLSILVHPPHPVYSEPCKLPLGFWHFTPVQCVLPENKSSDPTYLGALTLVWCNSLILFASSFPGPLLFALSWPLSSGFPPGPLFNLHQHSDFSEEECFIFGTLIGEFNPICISGLNLGKSG